jgi:hypothetical protein
MYNPIVKRIYYPKFTGKPYTFINKLNTYYKRVFTVGKVYRLTSEIHYADGAKVLCFTNDENVVYSVYEEDFVECKANTLEAVNLLYSKG